MTLAMIHEILADHNLTSTQKLMLVALALHAEPDGTGAYPGMRRLQALTSLSSGWVSPILRQLEAAGYLTIDPRASPVGSNLYTLHLPPVSSTKSAPSSKPYAQRSNTPSTKTDPHTRDLNQDLPQHERQETALPQSLRQPLSTEAQHWLATSGLDPSHEFYQALAGTEAPPASASLLHQILDRLSALEEKQTPRRVSQSIRQSRLYDTSTTYLGKLCTRRHDYEGTGQSLRHKRSGNCVHCKTLDQKARRQAGRS